MSTDADGCAAHEEGCRQMDLLWEAGQEETEPGSVPGTADLLARWAGAMQRDGDKAVAWVKAHQDEMSEAATTRGQTKARWAGLTEKIWRKWRRAT